MRDTLRNEPGSAPKARFRSEANPQAKPPRQPLESEPMISPGAGLAQ